MLYSVSLAEAFLLNFKVQYFLESYRMSDIYMYSMFIVFALCIAYIYHNAL